LSLDDPPWKKRKRKGALEGMLGVKDKKGNKRAKRFIIYESHSRYFCQRICLCKGTRYQPSGFKNSRIARMQGCRG
jgi:hypothetical protein